MFAQHFTISMIPYQLFRIQKPRARHMHLLGGAKLLGLTDVEDCVDVFWRKECSDMCKEIRSRMKSGNAHFVYKGLPGTGKSVIAATYACTEREDQKDVIWIHYIKEDQKTDPKKFDLLIIPEEEDEQVLYVKDTAVKSVHMILDMMQHDTVAILDGAVCTYPNASSNRILYTCSHSSSVAEVGTLERRPIEIRVHQLCSEETQIKIKLSPAAFSCC